MANRVNFVQNAADVWDISRLPEPWNKLPAYMKMDDGLKNPYHQSGERCTLMTYVIECLIADVENKKMPGKPALIEFASSGSECWFGAEATDRETGKRIIADCKHMSSLNVVRAAIMENDTPTKVPAFANKAGVKAPIDLLPVYMVVLAVMCRTLPEFQSEYALASSCIAAGVAATSMEKKSLYRLCDMVYFAITSGAFTVSTPGGQLDEITKNLLAGGVFSGGKVHYGQSSVFANTKTVKVSGTSTFGEVKKEFESWASSRKWTPEEEAMIPQFPDDYPVMEEAVKIARRYISTHGDKRPMVNFMWRGITSYGKSTGVEMLAAFLHTPLLRMTCSSTMETQDFLSNFVPDNGDEAVCAVPDVSVEAMFCDPASAYLKITGIQKEDATDQDCLRAMMDAVAANARQGQARFKHVESNFVKAMSRGYICEIQEASRIKDAGVLVGLNEYDRPGSIIPLTNGGYTTRHPDAMCIYTDNVGYASCRPLDPSVIRRFSFIIDSFKMTDRQVEKRVLYNTGFERTDLLHRMMTCWKKLQDYCESHEYDEGSVSVTELEMWAACVKADGYGNVYQNAIDCMISKATSVQEEQQELIQSVLKLLFKEGE